MKEKREVSIEQIYTCALMHKATSSRQMTSP